ncbi:hypothetical protein DIPPA_32016 [Diplonema papillatum]|nr:hypothetical protein DIPPA_32016 [Diplonema papillatum]
MAEEFRRIKALKQERVELAGVLSLISELVADNRAMIEEESPVVGSMDQQAARQRNIFADLYVVCERLRFHNACLLEELVHGGDTNPSRHASATSSPRK